VAAFKAIVIEKTDSGTKAALADFDEANLMDGDVTDDRGHRLRGYG